MATTVNPVLLPENYALLQREVHHHSGIVLDDSKLYLMESRLLPLVKEERLGSLNELCQLLRAGSRPALLSKVVEAMTTNETLFFRDPPAFEALQKQVLPELLERRRSQRKLSVWSAAASTGQEAYSVAMLLLELGASGWEIQLLGTDLNSQVLERARAGRFLQIEVGRGLPPEYLQRHFQRVDAGWQISELVRKMVKFQQFDLRRDQRVLGSFDLVLCRNVLIYFDVVTKKQILSGIRGVLAPDGFLLLGCAESTVNLDDSFGKRVLGQTTFYQLR